MPSASEIDPLSGEFHYRKSTPVVKSTTPPEDPQKTGPPGPSEVQSGGHTRAAGPSERVNGREEYPMTDLVSTSSQLTAITGLEHLTRRHELLTERESIDSNQALVYLRVSTLRQMNTAADIDADGNSIATQRETVLKKVAALKTTVAREFVEPGTSAQTIAKRPVFREMLRYVDEHPEIGYVVIYMRSRVFRNFTDAAITKRALLEKGVRLVSAKEEFGDGYMGDAMEAITDIMNEVQVRQSGEDIKVKMRHKAESGGTVGRARLGYLNVRKEFDGRLVNTIDVDPVRAPLVQWAFETYATGDCTLTQLQAALADQGLTTRPSASRPARPLSVSQLSVILHDPYYTGVMPFKGDLYPGRHQPLISKELFLRVQGVLAERAKRGQRDRVHHHYLKGLLFCERCKTEGRTSRLIYTEVNGNGGTYEYFVCRSGLCNLGSLPRGEVEAAVAQRFAMLELPSDFISMVREEIMSVLENSQEADLQMRASLRKQLAKLDAREDQFLDLAADQELSTQKLKERIRSIKLERANIEERLGRTDTQIARGAKTLLAYLELLADPGNLYRNSVDGVRRQLLEAFYSELFADEDTDSITVRAVQRPVVAELQEAVRALRDQAAAANAAVKGSSLRSSTEATSVVSTSVALLAGHFRGLGLNKAALVGLTGFEPATP